MRASAMVVYCARDAPLRNCRVAAAVPQPSIGAGHYQYQDLVRAWGADRETVIASKSREDSKSPLLRWRRPKQPFDQDRVSDQAAMRAAATPIRLGG
jgi:hypothetical protein